MGGYAVWETKKVGPNDLLMYTITETMLPFTEIEKTLGRSFVLPYLALREELCF